MDCPTIRLVRDTREIDKILYDPDIYERTSDDFTPPAGDWVFPYQDFTFFGGYLDRIVALFYLHDSRLGKEVHFQVLPEYRKSHGMIFGKMFTDLCFSIYGDLVGEIPECYPNVLKFAERQGFKEIGINEKSFKKCGQWHDTHILVYQG